MKIIQGWTDKETKAFRKSTIQVQHRLNETGLFTDDALARLIDKHPNNMVDVCAMARNPELFNRHQTVDFRGVDGAIIIDLVKRGQLWVNIREGMTKHKEYKEVMDKLLDELEAHTGVRNNRNKCYGGILVSSKTAKVAFHCDATQTILWHIRGTKHAYVYPINDKFLPDKAYEKIVIGEPDEDVSYVPEFDSDAQVFELHGGEMVTWRHPSPHRVENKTFCVSMVTEFCTKDTTLYNLVSIANGLMRRHLGLNPNIRNASKFNNFCKLGTGFALRTLGADRIHQRKDLVQFKLNPDSPEVLTKIEPYERDF